MRMFVIRVQFCISRKLPRIFIHFEGRKWCRNNTIISNFCKIQVMGKWGNSFRNVYREISDLLRYILFGSERCCFFLTESCEFTQGRYIRALMKYFHSDATPALLYHKEPARSKQRPVGSLRSKAPSRGLWMPELVLYGIRELARPIPLI